MRFNCNIPIHEYVKCTLNVHNTYIDNIGIPKHKKITYDFLVQVRNFITFLNLKVFRHREREAQSFYADFSICPPTTTCGTRRKASASSESQPSSSDAKTQLTDFSQISAHVSGAWRHSHPWSHSYLGFLFWYLWMMRPLRARVNTRVHVAPN